MQTIKDYKCLCVLHYKYQGHNECIRPGHLCNCKERRGHCGYQQGWTAVGSLISPACRCFVFASVQHLIISISALTGARTIDSVHMSLELIAAYLCLSRRNNWHQIMSYLPSSGCCHSDALHACLPLIHCACVCMCVYIEIEVQLSDPDIKSGMPVSCRTNQEQRKIDLSSEFTSWVETRDYNKSISAVSDDRKG